MAMQAQRMVQVDAAWTNQMKETNENVQSNVTRSVEREQEDEGYPGVEKEVRSNESNEASIRLEKPNLDWESWEHHPQLSNTSQQNDTLRWKSEGKATMEVEGQKQEEEFQNKSIPRLGYIIMSSQGRLHGLVSLLTAIYHPSNAYAVHIDSKTPEKEDEILEREVKTKTPANVIWLRSAAVTWGGVSMLLVTLRGLATLRKELGDHWDFYINLSASDMPLLPQESIAHALAEMPAKASFMSGAPYVEPDQGSDIHRSTRIVVDTSLSLGKDLKYTLEWPEGNREEPTIFVPYKGEGWFLLSRELAALATDSAAYWPTLLLSYFTNWFASDESYMQTLACTDSGRDASTAFSDHFRHILWSGASRGHPDILRGPKALEAAFSSGAFFARKFTGDGIERRALIHHMPNSAGQVKLQDDPGYQDIYAVYKKFSQVFFKNLATKLNKSVIELETQVDNMLHFIEEMQPIQKAALSSRIKHASDHTMCV